MRMLAYPDLFAMDAKYHRSCYSHYISERNIRVAKSKAAGIGTKVANKDDAFERLCEELAGTVLSPANAVTSLATLYNQLQELTECECGYSQRTLKVKLRDRFAERLSFIAQPGKSDIVCSSHITVGEALRKTVELQARVDEMADSQSEPTVNISDGDKAFLHKAAGIIRRCISGLAFQANTYEPIDAFDKRKLKDFVQDSLYDFIAWCSSKKDFDGGISYDSESDMTKIDLKVVVCATTLFRLGARAAPH